MSIIIWLNHCSYTDWQLPQHQVEEYKKARNIGSILDDLRRYYDIDFSHLAVENQSNLTKT